MPNSIKKILVVDDSPENIQLLLEVLKDTYTVIVATNGEKALQLAAKEPQPDLILLDVIMSGMSGYEVCSCMKTNIKTREIPIVFVTALNEAIDVAQGFELGAVDYISKPINPAIVKARVQNHLKILGLTRSLQKVNRDLADFNLSLERLVQERTAELYQATYFDSLTGLLSRASLLRDLDSALELIHQSSTQGFALLVLDCMQFSLINNSFGHAIGDQILIAIGERFTTHMPTGDSLYRIGGDKFCFLLHRNIIEAQVVSFAEQIIQTFSEPFVVEEYEIFANARLGITIAGNHYHQAVELIRDVDTALQKARSNGIAGYYIFQRSLHDFAFKRLRLENDLRLALVRGEFVVFYQPIINLSNRKIDSFEALIRWQHPQRGLVSPIEFIPCLEETGSIVPVGMFVLHQACAQLQEWQKTFNSELSISVNLAARQMVYPKLLADIDFILKETNCNPERLKLEVTESGLLEVGQQTIDLLQALRDRGIRISIDDFGTGYSSLAYLQKLPVDTLKIDRVFVKDIQANGENAEIVQAVIQLGKALGKDIIAEGCETNAQVTFLKGIGCDFAQGYHFAEPMDVAHVGKFITKFMGSDLEAMIN